MKKLSINSNINLIPSSRAAQLSGYSQDYVGQLCRSGSISCKRISGEWQVDLDTLLMYKKRFSSDETELNISSMESSLNPVTGHQATLADGEKQYLSSGDAAKRTGYSQDYIGQLARSGAVTAKKVGRKWFIEQDSLEQHKKHNDNLLAAVQANSVGVTKTESNNIKNIEENTVTVSNIHKTRAIPVVTYKHDNGSLVPGSVTQSDLENKTQHVENTVEVKSMPISTINKPIERKDLRSKQSTNYNPDRQQAFESKELDLFDTEHVDGEYVYTEELVKTHVVSKFIAVTIILISIAILGSSFFFPDRLHKHLITFSNIIGVNLSDAKSIDGLWGKNVLDLFSSKIIYNKNK